MPGKQVAKCKHKQVTFSALAVCVMIFGSQVLLVAPEKQRLPCLTNCREGGIYQS
jgi:hypothetical protein